MLSTIGSTTNTSNSAQIAALQKQLAQDEKQLVTDESVGGKASAASAELVATQITLVESEIAQLSKSGSVAAASTSSALGNNLDVTA